MLDTYTVSFFGHRTIHLPFVVEERVKEIASELIRTKEYVEFLVGREGFFDLICTSALRKAINELDYGNTSLVLVLPYMKAEYRDNIESFYRYYNDVEICEESSSAHYKAAIGIRNRSMVDRSDLVVCCVEREYGGAYNAMKYAQKQNIEIMNVAVID